MADSLTAVEHERLSRHTSHIDFETPWMYEQFKMVMKLTHVNMLDR